MLRVEPSLSGRGAHPLSKLGREANKYCTAHAPPPQGLKRLTANFLSLYDEAIEFCTLLIYKTVCVSSENECCVKSSVV